MSVTIPSAKDSTGVSFDFGTGLVDPPNPTDDSKIHG